jgi:hypothetical protein
MNGAAKGRVLSILNSRALACGTGRAEPVVMLLSHAEAAITVGRFRCFHPDVETLHTLSVSPGPVRPGLLLYCSWGVVLIAASAIVIKVRHGKMTSKFVTLLQ